MPKPTCSHIECDRIVYARKLCAFHYRKWRVADRLANNTAKICSVDGCDRIHESRGFCSLHVSRVRKTGHPGPVGRINQKYPDVCQVDECGREPVGKGWCKTHYSRWIRTGSVEERSMVGASAPNWSGEDISYRGAHKRVTRERGDAREHDCVDCGAQASHWSYDHSDPDEKLDPKYGYPFSLDVARYYPRCYVCHKQFDMGDTRAC